MFATAMNIFLPILALLLLQLLIPGAGLVVVVLTTDVNALLPVGIPRRRYYTQESSTSRLRLQSAHNGKKTGPVFFFFLLVIAPVKDGPCGQRRR